MGETLRYALNAVAEVAPIWLKSLAPAEWYDRYSKRLEDSRLPRTPIERSALAELIGVDGFYLLDHIYSQTSPIQLRQLPAVEVLRQVWLQQYYAPTDKIQLRSDKDGPPSAVRIRSPYDEDARNSTKRTTNWTLYKVHLTESCDENLPHIITHVETTPATTQDQTVVPSIHQALEQKDLLPHLHLVDQGYTSSQLLSGSQRDYDIDLFGPVAVNIAWQAKAGLGFDISHFRVNWKRKVVYCPQGKRSSRWKNTLDVYGHPVIHVNFRTKDCKNCPVRSQCTRAANDPRALTIQAQPDYEAASKSLDKVTHIWINLDKPNSTV
ncbi:hypothetical protein NUACC21_06290 [Scytonema sp. NUACC21]